MESETKQPLTIDKILEWIADKVENRIPISPAAYLDLAAKLMALLGNLDEDLITAEMTVNQETARFKQIGESAAAAKMLAKNTEAYRTMRSLEAKKNRVMETIRIAKKRTELREGY